MCHQNDVKGSIVSHATHVSRLFYKSGMVSKYYSSGMVSKYYTPRLISWVIGSCCVGSLGAPLNLYYKLISCNSNLVVKRIVCTLFHS